jgi:TIGR03009 family protein
MSICTPTTCRLLATVLAAGLFANVALAQQARPANRAPVVATRQPARATAPLARNAAAPFQLTAVQQKVLHQVLVNYEQKTGAIKTFSTELTRMEYDPVFGSSDPNTPRTIGSGTLRYTKPDKALYEVGNIRVYDNRTKKYSADANATESVVVTGKQVIVKNFRKKQVLVTDLPKEMQGQGIFYGPLPFLFGAKAADLQRRYFMRLTTPEHAAKGGQIWIEAWPRFQADAANYKRVDLMIRSTDMLPVAIQIHSPNGKNRTVYTFANSKVDPYKWNPFSDEFKVRTPFGWKRIVEKPPVPGPRRAANPKQPPQR